MKMEIVVLNVLKYEKEGKKGTRLSFILADRKDIENSVSFKGMSDNAFYYSGHEVFDIIPIDLICQPGVVAVFEDKANVTNKFKKTTTIVSLIYNNKEYKLC